VVKQKRAFTLIELLVVMAIIGLLIAILLHAVQAAREAARRASCQNHLRQLGVAAHNHVEQNGFFPSGGWCSGWMGDSDMRPGMSQPGNWMFSLLPFLEQSELYKLAGGDPGWPVPAAKQARMLQVQQTPVDVFYCPSRRDTKPIPWSGQFTINWPSPAIRTPIARNDYAGNLGSLQADPGWPVQSVTYDNHMQNTGWPTPSQFNGIIFPRSQIRPADIIDGLSGTYLFGEKYLPIPEYHTGLGPGDDEGVFTGYNADNARSSHPNFPPRRDAEKSGSYWSWGSPHPGGFNMLFCDGSARAVSFTITPDVHSALGSRNGAEQIDKKSY